MNRMLLLAVAIMIVSCKQEETKDLPQTLDEVEFFYMERAEALVYHLDPECGSNCVYVEKDEVIESRLCGKCISRELAREIMSKQ